MTYAPATLIALGKIWTSHGGVNLGIVGDQAHAAKGYSYHLGEDQLAPDAYSVKTARDKAGLSNAASAIDLGKVNGSITGLREFSDWLVEQARANKPGTSDMREIIYSPDGKTVLRWDRERGYASAPKAGEADDTHLTHTHISWYRDAEWLDHATAFLPYWKEADVRFANANGYAVDSNKRMPVVKGDKWTYLDGTPGGTIDDATLKLLADRKTPDQLVVVGTIDSTPNEYLVLLPTETPYPNDTIARETLVRIPTTRALVGAPVAPALDCSAQREKDRVAVLAAVEGVFA